MECTSSQVLLSKLPLSHIYMLCTAQGNGNLRATEDRQSLYLMPNDYRRNPITDLSPPKTDTPRRLLSPRAQSFINQNMAFERRSRCNSAKTWRGERDRHPATCEERNPERMEGGRSEEEMIYKHLPYSKQKMSPSQVMGGRFPSLPLLFPPAPPPPPSKTWLFFSRSRSLSMLPAPC